MACPELQLMLLARAVRPPELDSLVRLNRFDNPLGIECKYFCTSIEGAMTYAQMAQRRYGDGPYTIVVTAIDRSLLSKTSSVVVDGGIEAVTVPTELLYSLRPPTFPESA